GQGGQRLLEVVSEGGGQSGQAERRAGSQRGIGGGVRIGGREDGDDGAFQRRLGDGEGQRSPDGGRIGLGQHDQRRLCGIGRRRSACRKALALDGAQDVRIGGAALSRDVGGAGQGGVGGGIGAGRRIALAPRHGVGHVRQRLGQGLGGMSGQPVAAPDGGLLRQSALGLWLGQVQTQGVGGAVVRIADGGQAQQDRAGQLRLESATFGGVGED